MYQLILAISYNSRSVAGSYKITVARTSYKRRRVAALRKVVHSKDIRKAAAVAHGAKIKESASSAPSNERFASTPEPKILASTAPAPNINTGIYRGNTRIEMSTPPPRKPSVKAAPTDPISARTGVPSSNETTSTISVFEPSPN